MVAIKNSTNLDGVYNVTRYIVELMSNQIYYKDTYNDLIKFLVEDSIVLEIKQNKSVIYSSICSIDPKESIQHGSVEEEYIMQ